MICFKTKPCVYRFDIEWTNSSKDELVLFSEWVEFEDVISGSVNGLPIETFILNVTASSIKTKMMNQQYQQLDDSTTSWSKPCLQSTIRYWQYLIESIIAFLTVVENPSVNNWIDLEWVFGSIVSESIWFSLLFKQENPRDGYNIKIIWN